MSGEQSRFSSANLAQRIPNISHETTLVGRQGFQNLPQPWRRLQEILSAYPNFTRATSSIRLCRTCCWPRNSTTPHLTGHSPESSEKRSDQRVSVPQIQFSSLSSFTKGRVRTDSLEEIYLPLDWVQSTTDAIERVFDCNKQIRPRNNCIELGFQGSCAARLRVISEEHVSRQCIRSHVRQSERRGYSGWRRVNSKALNSTPPNLNDSVLQCTDEIGKIGPKHVNRVDKHWSWE